MPFRPIGSFHVFIGCTLALTGVPAIADTATSTHYTGVAYAIGTKDVRYREEHWITEDHGRRERLVLYHCPDGRPFARKHLTYGSTAWTPSFDVEDARTGYTASVKTDGDHLTVTVRKASGKPAESATLAIHPDTVVDAGFDDFVRAHWASIDRPEGMSASFVVPSRLGDLRLKIKPSPAAAPDPRFRQFRMTLDGWWGALAPTIDLTYTTSDHRLVTFEGLSDIKGNDGKNQKVHIVFPSDGGQQAVSPDDLEKARSVPLVNRCAA